MKIFQHTDDSNDGICICDDDIRNLSESRCITITKTGTGHPRLGRAQVLILRDSLNKWLARGAFTRDNLMSMPSVRAMLMAELDHPDNVSLKMDTRMGEHPKIGEWVSFYSSDDECMKTVEYREDMMIGGGWLSVDPPLEKA